MKQLETNTDMLLLEITTAAGLNFMSDLHGSLWKQEVIDAIHAIEENKYSLACWTEAVNYIINSTEEYESVQEAKTKLLKFR